MSTQVLKLLKNKTFDMDPLLQLRVNGTNTFRKAETMSKKDIYPNTFHIYQNLKRIELYT